MAIHDYGELDDIHLDVFAKSGISAPGTRPLLCRIITCAQGGYRRAHNQNPGL